MRSILPVHGWPSVFILHDLTIGKKYLHSKDLGAGYTCFSFFHKDYVYMLIKFKFWRKRLLSICFSLSHFFLLINELSKCFFYPEHFLGT